MNRAIISVPIFYTDFIQQYIFTIIYVYKNLTKIFSKNITNPKVQYNSLFLQYFSTDRMARSQYICKSIGAYV